VTRALSRVEVGNRVFAELCENDPTLAEALEHTGLSKSQWHKGLAYVKDVLAEVHAEPVVYDHKYRVYRLAFFESEVNTYIGRRLVTFLVQLRRLYNGSFVPAGIKLETARTREFSQVDKLVRRLIEDLDELREDMGIPLSEALRMQAADRAGAGLDG
jgi:hypothetical protein